MTDSPKYLLFSASWWGAAAVRAIKTAAQVAVGTLGVGAIGLVDVDWAGLGSLAGVAALLSLVTSLAGLPEVPTQEG